MSSLLISRMPFSALIMTSIRIIVPVRLPSRQLWDGSFSAREMNISLSFSKDLLIRPLLNPYRISMRLTCCPPFSHGIIFPNLPGKRQILPMHGMRESGFLFPRNAEGLFFLITSFIRLFAVTYHKKATDMPLRSPMVIRSSGNAARIISPCRLLFQHPLEI